MSTETRKIFAGTQWADKFRTKPGNATLHDEEFTADFTTVVCMHPHHGVDTFYLRHEEFQDNIRSLLVPYWINNFTITIITNAN